MNVWDPYAPVVYILHTLLGTAGVVAATVALLSLKGGILHVRAGRIFAAFASVASVTAIVFSATRFSPFAVVSALIVLSLVAGAILAVRPRTSLVAVGELATALLMTIASAALLVMIVLPLLGGAPLLVVAWPAAYLLFPAWFLFDDVKFLRAEPDARRSGRLRRHLSRMAFALAIAVHAPIVSFGDRLGIDPAVAFFGPFVLWPAILLVFRNHPMLSRKQAVGAA